MAVKRRKPTPGHKLKGYSYGVSARCECGWTSATTFGKGARSDAAAQFDWHRRQFRCEGE